jgi:hypothetical protein
MDYLSTYNKGVVNTFIGDSNSLNSGIIDQIKHAKVLTLDDLQTIANDTKPF